MNSLLVFTAALLTFVVSSPMPEDTSSIGEVINQIRSVVDSIIDPEVKVNLSSITYWFFSKENPEDGVPVNEDSLSGLNDTSFNTARDNIFIVHGWQNNITSAFITTVRRAIVANLDVNIFVVDWSEIAAGTYISARNAVPEVGKYLGQFIESLVLTFGLSLNRTTLVGHSLGGHVVGNAGGALNGSIGVIVALDPALPLFLTIGDDKRLDPSDAQFVQVIHTNGGLKGFVSPLGDSDYYVNGGSTQPGCSTDIAGRCAHARAFEYYAESLSTDQFIGVACNDLLDFSNVTCSSTNTSVMGTYNIDKKASGLYYLTTNDKSPFARGLNGTNGS